MPSGVMNSLGRHLLGSTQTTKMSMSVKQQSVTTSRLACVIYSRRIPACEMDTRICISLAWVLNVLSVYRLSLLVLMVWPACIVDFGGLEFQPCQ